MNEKEENILGADHTHTLDRKYWIALGCCPIADLFGNGEPILDEALAVTLQCDARKTLLQAPN